MQRALLLVTGEKQGKLCCPLFLLARHALLFPLNLSLIAYVESVASTTALPSFYYRSYHSGVDEAALLAPRPYVVWFFCQL